MLEELGVDADHVHIILDFSHNSDAAKIAKSFKRIPAKKAVERVSLAKREIFLGKQSVKPKLLPQELGKRRNHTAYICKEARNRQKKKNRKR